jgi:hypothetical protein
MTSAPSPYPANYLPTVIYLTAQAINAATQAQTLPSATLKPLPTDTATLVPPTAEPSDTPTPGPSIPLAAIQLKAPGPMSRVISPLQVQMLAIAGDSRRIEIDLFGEDGTLLGRTVNAVAGSPGGDPLSVKLPFEIRAAGENGFIQVSTKDSQGRIQSLVTLQILLLSSGASQINPAGNTIYERVALVDLPPGTQASGGILKVAGQVLPYNRQPVILELISDDGHSLGLRVLTTTGTDWQPFNTTIPFRVSSSTPARLFVHQADDILGGQAYIYSQEIVLNP